MPFFGVVTRMQGGHCLVAWVKVCLPIELGGLRISYLKTLGSALRMRWICIIILGAWILWNRHNCCVFDGSAPSVARSLIMAGDERRLWTQLGLDDYPSCLPHPWQLVHSAVLLASCFSKVCCTAIVV